MNARLQPRALTGHPVLAVGLLGNGAVGGALLARLAARRPAGILLCALANSTRQLADPAGLDAAEVGSRLASAERLRHDASLMRALDASGAHRRVLVDATASQAVARRHPYWLAQGYHVVTANKALNGGSSADWRVLAAAGDAGGARYAASATVGAGLPVIDTLARWCLGGDRVTAIGGVFSGCLSWLFNHYDGTQPFSELLRQARTKGYSEPDPRQDLSGQDVARKLLILARSAGLELDHKQVEVDNLVPQPLRELPLAAFEQRMGELDGCLAARLQSARSRGRVLRHMARLDDAGARVGLDEVLPDDPAACLRGSDNLFVLSSRSYSEQPVIIRGPGAGTGVTAQALLADILQLQVDRHAAPEPDPGSNQASHPAPVRRRAV